MITIDLLRTKITQLQANLESSNPGYKQYLQEIHSQLLKEPELIHLLKTDGEISVVIEGMKRYKQMEIPITAPKGGGTKLKGPINLDQF